MREKPEHGPVPELGNWWACEFPERPLDWNGIVLQGCPFCQLHLKADLRTRSAEFLWDYYEGDTPDKYRRIEDIDSFLEQAGRRTP